MGTFPQNLQKLVINMAQPALFTFFGLLYLAIASNLIIIVPVVIILGYLFWFYHVKLLKHATSWVQPFSVRIKPTNVVTVVAPELQEIQVLELQDMQVFAIDEEVVRTANNALSKEVERIMNTFIVVDDNE